MQKIFRILMLMLTAALVACGGGGEATGSNPNQTTLVTTAGTNIILPVGITRDYQISGGVPPYRINNTDQVIAEGYISGNTLAIRTFAAGAVTVNVLDYSGASVSIAVQVGSSTPLYTTAPGDLMVGVGSNVARTFRIGGGAAPYTVEGGDSNVALVQMIGATEWKATGVATGATTAKIRDAAGVEVSIALSVGSPELRMSPTNLTMPVGIEATAKISGGQPPYRVAGGIPAAITLSIQGDELRIKGSLASELDVSVMDAAGQIVMVKVTINTATTSIRLSPSAVSVSENDTQTIKFGIFGATGATCVFVSDPTFFKPVDSGCMNRTTVTLETGTRGSRCVDGNKIITLTVVDADRSTATADVTIVDNGSCSNFSVLPATTEVRTGEVKQLTLTGGSGTYVVASDNARVATATASGGVVIVTGGAVAGNANITIRDQSDASKVVTLPVSVIVDAVPSITTSPQTLAVKSGVSADVLISGGSGNFDLAVSNNQMATVALSGRTLRVTGGATLGTATVTIRDKTDPSRTAVVTVTVSAGGVSVLSASPSALTIQPGAAADTLISGGSGQFELAVSNTQVATAALTGRTLRITAGATAGVATVTVRDAADATRVFAINITVVAGTGTLIASPSSLSIQSGASADVLISGGSGRFDFAVDNSARAIVSLSGNKLTITGGTVTGRATVTVRDQADQSRIVTINVDVTSATAPVAPMTALPNTATGSVQETLNFLLQNGTAPYTVLVSNPAIATATITGNNIVASLRGAGTATLVVTDSRGQTINIPITANQAQSASLRFSPSAFEVGEDSLAPITLTVFGGTPPYRALTSDLTLSNVSVNGDTFTVGLGTRGSRCINPVDTSDPPKYIPRGFFNVIMTVVDSGGAFATSTMTIRDNGTGMPGTCPQDLAFSTTAGAATSVLVGSSLTFSIRGGSLPYNTPLSSNPAVATAVLSSETGLSITGISVGSSTVTVRDAAGEISPIVVTVTN